MSKPAHDRPRDPDRDSPVGAGSSDLEQPDAVRPQRWGLISNHGAVLGVLARDPNVTVREMARTVGVTERSATNLLRDLREAGFVEVRRIGRRNLYSVNLEQKLRRAGYRDSTVGELLAALHAMADLGAAERRSRETERDAG